MYSHLHHWKYEAIYVALTLTQGFSLDGKTESPKNIVSLKNNAVNEFQCP